MVEITSLEEDEFIRSLALAENKTLDYWIGLEEKHENENFNWMDGSPLTFTFWDSDAKRGPYDAGSDCIRMRASVHLWNDQGCDREIRALCEGNETGTVRV